MDERTILAVLGILAMLVVAVILRYRRKGEAEFSIRDWIRFRFSGSNETNVERPDRSQESKVDPQSQINVNEFVGRDKITTHIHPPPQESVQPSPLPKLSLKLFTIDDRTYRDEIVFGKVPFIRYREFNFALENTVASTTAERIDIRVVIEWQGDQLDKAPEFTVHLPPSEGWKADVSKLKHNQPAILTFHGSQHHRCSFRQPLEWNNFMFHLGEQVTGFFQMHYVVSSAEPATENSGELRIVIGG